MAAATGEPVRYVATKAIRAAVAGRAGEVLDALGVNWRGGRPHVVCVYPGHDDRDPSWRLDERIGRIFCTCITDKKSDDVFDAIRKIKRVDFEAAKLFAAEVLHREDLIGTKGAGAGIGQKTDPESLLDPPAGNRDDGLPYCYLAGRLGVDVTEIPAPTTRMIGIKSLGYFDPPLKNGGNAKPILIASPPCAVWETIAADGRVHAHRTYLSADGSGKADLGTMPNGKARDPKKSASRAPDAPTTAGCAVWWGDPNTAQVLLFEGIENAAVAAVSYASEIAAGKLAVASAISAGGIEAFEPWPATTEIVVCGDRDEGKPGAGFKRGELAARKLAVRLAKDAGEGRQLKVLLALPGEPGTKYDFLDLFREAGIAGVRAAIAAALPIEPSADDIRKFEQETAQQNAIARIAAAYPLPAGVTAQLQYRARPSGEIWVFRFAGEKKDAAGEVKQVWQPVCSPFAVAAWLRLFNAGDTYGLRIVVADRSGDPRTLDLDRAELPRLAAAEIRSRLMAAGLRVSNGGELVIVEVLKEANPAAEIAAAAHCGWHIS